MARRFFSRSERRAIYRRAGGCCEQCSAAIGRDFHADHVTPFALGGETSIDNGQALCGPCNLIKGSKMKKRFTLSPRVWQQDHLASCIAKLVGTNRAGRTRLHMSVATPAAGKTYAGSMLAAEMFNRGEIDRVIVLVNALTTIGGVDAGVFNGWVGDLMLCEVRAYADSNDSLSYGMRKGMEAVVTTYASVAANPGVLKALIKGKRVLLICDEPHHLADDATWGERVAEAAQAIPFVLLMTGTPVRTSGFMPWPELYSTQRVDGDTAIHTVKPDHIFSYLEALTGPEQVVRPLEFVPFDAKGRWIQDEAICEGDFDDELDHKGRSALLRAACNPSHEAAQGALRLGIDKLTELRLTDPTAAMLVVCMGSGENGTEYRHVDAAAKYLKRQGVPAVVVHSEVEGAAEKIAAFRKTAEPCIASIAMISEGTSIKRIRVIVYLTNVVTNLTFDQIVGRALRVDTSSPIPLPEQFAYIVHPADSRLKEFARSYKDATLQFRTSKRASEGPGPGEGKPTRILDSEFKGRQGGIHFDGEEFDQAEIAEAERVRKAVPGPGSDSYIAKLLRVSKAAFAEVFQPAGPRVDTRDPVKLNSKAAELVKKLVIARGGPPRRGKNDFGARIVATHTEFNNMVGAKTQAESKRMSNDQLDQKIALLEEALASGSSSGRRAA